MKSSFFPDLFVQTTSQMMRQLHAVYGEWLLKDRCWNFVVDHFKGARMLFLSEGLTHADLVAMAQENYNLDMNTESVELTYSLQQNLYLFVQTTSQVSRLAVDDLPGSRLVNAEMMRQLHAMYGEWLLKDGCWNFVVDHFKGARMLFLSEESVELTYSLQQMAPDLPSIHVTSDRQVQNLLEITKTHEVRLCVSRFSKMRTVSEEMDEAEERDEAEEGDEAEVGDEPEEGDEAKNHDGEEDAEIPVVANAEDYSEYGKVKDEDEEEDDEISFEDYKGAYGCEGK
ncbi:hypothetical protein F2Q69_00060140 [Brassica cretica]|uniref:Uncharacterized protein n=1 Tax=Brassica cretica TaxID=69181 RepID=A0A8S9RF28_BRACR|nr:hypothetical protein F2Q69_00060140 [Brassica cretica]